MTVSLYKNGSKLEDLNVFTYSDSVPGVKVNDYASASRADTMVITGTSLTEFFAAMVYAQSDAGYYLRKLVIPYIPGARQDRENSPDGDVCDTLTQVAAWISNKFGTTLVLDPHSDAAGYNIHNMWVYPLQRIVIPGTYDGVVAPDAGAFDRANAIAAMLELPVYYGTKERDVSTGAITDISIAVPEGKRLLVVDDICDGGGTFIPLGQQIREQGSQADLFVTHGIFSKGVTQLKEHFNNIYTTDSICTRDDVTIIPVVQDMVEYAKKCY